MYAATTQTSQPRPTSPSTKLAAGSPTTSEQRHGQFQAPRSPPTRTTHLQALKLPSHSRPATQKARVTAIQTRSMLPASRKKFYRWVSMTAEDARSIEQSGGDLDKAFEDKALKGEWFSPEPLGYLESAITMAVASEWTDRAEGTDGLKGETREGIVARCYEFTPPSGTESFEGHARHQGGLGQNPSPDSTGLRRIHADLIGGGTQAFIPRAGVERDAESWGMRRVDQHLPEDLRGTNNTGQERSPVESITPLDDPGPIPYTEFSGIIHKYVQP